MLTVLLIINKLIMITPLPEVKPRGARPAAAPGGLQASGDSRIPRLVVHCGLV